jgi:hypothetical protein
MRIKYEATLDEIVDVALRSFARVSVARSWLRLDAVVGALACGLVAGVGLFVITWDWEDYTSRLVFATLMGLLGVVLCPFLLASVRRERFRRYFHELLGGDGPYPFAVELLPEGLQVTQPGSRTILDWSQIEEIEETEHGIEVVVRQVGLQLLPERAFASEGEMKAFASEMRRYRELSGTVAE